MAETPAGKKKKKKKKLHHRLHPLCNPTFK